jgi:prevent-host-death family protein
MERSVSATEARIHLGELMRWAVENDEPIIVERGGQPHVVLLSIAEYEQLKASGQRQSWQDALDQAVRVGAKIQSRRKGKPLTPPEEIIRQMREEQDAKFADLR